MADPQITTPSMQVAGNFPRDVRLYARDHATFLRDSLRETAREHHRRHIPWHFQNFAAAKYGFKPRTSKYRKWKARLGLPDLDLVFSGNTRRVVTTERQITATQKKATLIMRLPIEGGTGRFRKKEASLTSAQVRILQLIEEVRAIATDEIQYLGDYLGKQYTDRVNAPGTRFKQRTRSTAG